MIFEIKKSRREEVEGREKEVDEADEKDNNSKSMISFDYKTKGIMAEIGKRTGVGDLLGLKVHGFVAWWLWRSYYLSNLPTIQKKLRVMVDWSIDLFFKRDVTRIRTFAEEKGLRKIEEEVPR